MKSQTPPKELTQARLKELVNYDPETGIFTWRVNRRGKARAGTVAGCPHNKGYIQIKIDWRRYLAHRLAFLYVSGAWPSDQVDHMNGVRTDTRWCNLRESTNAQNQQNIDGPQKNNRCGYLGVSWHKGTRKWRATIKLDRHNYHLGYFDDPAEAAAAYLAAKDNLHPTHMRLREQADER